MRGCAICCSLNKSGMKVVTIGRGPECDVVVNHELVSRRHALLKLYGNGKIEIVDVGRNGTFINNVQLKPNVPTPVSRKDVVSFAHVKQLDWKQVPDVLRPAKITGGILAALAIIALLVWGIRSCGNGTPDPVITDSVPAATPTSIPISTEVKGDTATRLDMVPPPSTSTSTNAPAPEKLDASHFGITTPKPAAKKTATKKVASPTKKEEKPTEDSPAEKPAEKTDAKPNPPTEKRDSA